MKNMIISLLLNGLAVYIAAELIGVHVDGFLNAIMVALMLSLANATIGNFIKLVTTPLRWLTLGLLTFLINLGMIYLVDYLMVSFDTGSLTQAAIFGILLWFINGALMWIFGPGKK